MVQARSSTADVDDVLCEIVDKIAEVEDVDPLELTPPLYEVIDPEALGQMFATIPTADRMELRVSFPYEGYEVTVHGDGDVSVEE
ncbi:HalOD1 output domain-containing protein [Halorubrum yunnanense]|uniref:HalOD1 output domain-containing protein n=1 Tax=Halorubrum yunnanense TaxID=1526162 RepID=A0ABD5YGU4_9EURY|nr:HalOD1 output domain-containing protein [Halorubrum yunnanense]